MVTSAVLDTCVLVPGSLRDSLLRAAQAGLYRACWSDDILDELGRNLVRAGKLSQDKADRLLHVVRDAFPEAVVHDYAGLIDSLTCRPGDRHVLAAAIKGSAQIVVTFNLRHFPAAALRPHRVVAQHPDRFLSDLFLASPSQLVQIIVEQARDLRRPPATPDRVLATLAQHAPGFVQLLRQKVAERGADG